MADTTFVSTAHMHRGDTSCDTSADIHRRTETDEVKRTFGDLGAELLVRPAAEPAPDLDDEPPPRFTEADPVELDEAFDDAGLGAGGEVLHDLRPPDEEEEEQLEAASVAQLARAQGGGSSGVLDALEAAEAAHEAAHDSKGPDNAGDAAPSAKRRRLSGEAPSSSRPGAETVNMATRQRVVAKLAEALEGSSQFADDVEASACEAEAHLFARAPHRTVYMSAAANALRTAKTAPSLAELVRIATGEPKADVARDTPDQDTAVLPERFGLAGTVELAPKHDSLGADELAERRCDLHGDLDMDNDLPVEQEGRSHVQKDPKQGDS